VSATGHQVLSFVTRREIIRDTATATGLSPAPGKITEAKDIGCVAESFMSVFAVNGFPVAIALIATT